MYDKEEYLADRGFYFDIDELPFPQVRDFESLKAALYSPALPQLAGFKERFLQYEQESAIRDVAAKIFRGHPRVSIKDDQKTKVLVYLGLLGKQQASSFVRQMRAAVKGFDFDAKDYYVMLLADNNEGLKRNVEELLSIDDRLNFFVVKGRMNRTLSELLSYRFFELDQDKVYRREIARSYLGIDFSEVIFAKTKNDPNQMRLLDLLVGGLRDK